MEEWTEDECHNADCRVMAKMKERLVPALIRRRQVPVPGSVSFYSSFANLLPRRPILGHFLILVRTKDLKKKDNILQCTILNL
jgi:hypothetical protein